MFTELTMEFPFVSHLHRRTFYLRFGHKFVNEDVRGILIEFVVTKLRAS